MTMSSTGPLPDRHGAEEGPVRSPKGRFVFTRAHVRRVPSVIDVNDRLDLQSMFVFIVINQDCSVLSCGGGGGGGGGGGAAASGRGQLCHQSRKALTVELRFSPVLSGSLWFFPVPGPGASGREQQRRVQLWRWGRGRRRRGEGRERRRIPGGQEGIIIIDFLTHFWFHVIFKSSSSVFYLSTVQWNRIFIVHLPIHSFLGQQLLKIIICK